MSRAELELHKYCGTAGRVVLSLTAAELVCAKSCKARLAQNNYLHTYSLFAYTVTEVC
jgi:hypothetical protein